MNTYNYKIVYCIFEIFEPTETRNYFGHQEHQAAGFSTLPCYLIGENKIYVDNVNYELNYLVVPERALHNINNESHPEFNGNNQLTNGKIVNTIFNSLEDAQSLMDEKNDHFFACAFTDQEYTQRLEKTENYKNLFNEYKSFVAKHENKILQLQLLEKSNLTTDCHYCGKFFHHTDLFIYNEKTICSNCFFENKPKNFTRQKRK